MFDHFASGPTQQQHFTSLYSTTTQITMEEFHTPESSAYPDQMRTPGSVSTAQRSPLPASGGGGGTSASGKKRPAASDNDDDSDDSMDNNTSFFGRIVSSVTPWRRKNKRARSSLDSMSGSAIKSATRLPASEDSDRSNNINGGSGKKTLGKLNLEHKFHESPAAPVATTATTTTTPFAAMPVQTLNGPETANNNNNHNEGNHVAAKRVRLAEGTVTTSVAATTNANGGSEGAIKAVRIGGTTFVSSNTTTTAATNTKNTSNTVTFQDATKTPQFHIGSTTTKLKDVRGRNATPARGGARSKWGTPSAGARYGSNTTTTTTTTQLPQDGLMTAAPSGGIATTGNKGGYQRRSINSLSTTSRGGGYRRRAINARGYKPMGTLLSRIHADNTTTNGGGVGGRNGPAAGQTKQQSLFLSNSIADQILRDTQNKLFQNKTSGSNYQEVALFGVVQGINNKVSSNNGARTFEEEAAQYKAVTNKGSAVPRVRMNRVYGSGQIGKRAQLETAPSTATTAAATSFGTGGVTTTTTAGAGSTASISLQPSITGKSLMPATSSSFSASTRIAAAPETTKAVAFSADTTFAPYKPGPIPARGEGKTQLTPCKADGNLSQQMGEEISQLVSTEAFKRKAAQNNPFGDVGEATKTPKKSKGTPHPKKAGGSVMYPVSEAAGGTPFSFMPAGGAASSKVSTPMAFKYGKKSDVPQSSSPAVKSKSPEDSAAPVANDTAGTSTTTTAAQGWGDLWKNQSKQWSCNACLTHNPQDKTQCLACETPREGSASKSDSTHCGDKGDSAKTASVGTGGFTFGAPASTTAPAPAASSAGSIGAGGFSFGNSSSSASSSAPAIKFGVTPSKTEQQKDDTKSSSSAGFSFGGATPAKAKPSSGGFSFGGTSTASSTTAESKFGASDEKKNGTSIGSSAGFSFGAPAASSSTSSSSSKANATFSFGQNAASSGADENKGDTANTGAFQFGAKSTDSKSKRGRGDDEENAKQDGGKKASVGAGFSFGANATENKSTPAAPFAFGAASKKDEAPSASTTTFAFGSTTSEKKADNSATSFAFGSAPATSEKKNTTASTSTPGFSFGQSATSATTTNAEKKGPAFSFGQAASATSAPEKKDNSASTSAPAFAFGAAAASATPAPEEKDNSSSTSAPAFAFGAAAPSNAPKTPAPAAAFQFGSQAPAAAPPAAASLFGGTGFGMTQPAAPAPAFGFGAAAPTPAPAAPAPAFGFGVSAQPPAAPATTTGFAFGSNPATAATPAPLFGMPPAVAPAATPAPAFGMPSAATPAPPTGFGGSGFGGAQAPAMNSGAASGGFNIGTGGAKKTPGRRIVKARRPQGSGR
jgi:hypothetical protein